MKRLYIILAACCFVASATAQVTKVKSQIKGTDGLPVGGAIISVVGDSISALSDKSGYFELNANNREALVTIKAEGYYERSFPLRLLTKKPEYFSTTSIPSSSAIKNASTHRCFFL